MKVSLYMMDTRKMLPLKARSFINGMVTITFLRQLVVWQPGGNLYCVQRMFTDLTKGKLYWTRAQQPSTARTRVPGSAPAAVKTGSFISRTRKYTEGSCISSQ